MVKAKKLITPYSLQTQKRGNNKISILKMFWKSAGHGFKHLTHIEPMFSGGIEVEHWLKMG